MNRPTLRGTFSVLASLLFVASAAFAQDKPIVTPADYGRFESLGSAVVSPNGDWFAYEIRRVNEENELRIRSMTEDSVRVVAWATRPIFSANSRWLAWTQGASKEETEKLEKAKKPVRSGVGLLDLKSGEEKAFDDVRALAFDGSGRFIALHGYAPSEPSGKGADLRLLDLELDTETTLGNVSEFSWSDESSTLALVISTGADAGNGIQIFDPLSGRFQGLVSSSSKYLHLSWREDFADLAVLQSEESASEDSSAYRLLAWTQVNTDEQTFQELDFSATDLSDGFEIVEHASPRWSKDGSKISFGLRPIEEEEDEEDESADADSTDSEKSDEKDVELPGLELWHSSDVRIIPMQKAQKSFDERRTLLAVWKLDENQMVKLGTNLRAGARLMEEWGRALEQLDEPYPWGAMFGRRYHDAWVIDAATGDRELVLEKVRYNWTSTAGRWLLSFDGSDFHSVDLVSGEKHNLTADLSSEFANTDYDTPTDMLPPHGFGGWFENDGDVLLYDKYDIWRIAPDGSGGRRLTNGRDDRVKFRIARLPDDDVPGFSADEPLYFTTFGEWTKKSGYARLSPDGSVDDLLFLNKRVRGLMKADSAAVYLYRAESYDDSPDYFAAGPDLDDARQITSTNPFMDEFAWSHPELVDFVSESGRPLQAALLYPANYRKGDRVPMIVYTYEIVSQNMHAFEVPSERDYYNFNAWTQNGYAVLLPDIVYTAREPGMSALAAVRAAVAKIVEMGVADANRVGLIGHSWGGYQAAFLPTRTNIFAASVAGAPLTDFVSFMGSIHWNQGMPEVSHWETGQGRMEVPFWEDPEAHRRNSPIHKIQDLETPILMAFGSADGVVDYDQGTEFYNFARRAEKEMVLVVYEGENHGFRKEPNQKDYHRRILEWFGHYLKGEPAPDWIKAGIPAGKQEDEARRLATKKMN